jgi:hypothetical protein
MDSRLDQESRHTIGRFFLKLAVSTILSSIGKSGTGAHLSISVWLTIYAVLAIGFALGRREKLRADGFNHWNEALWLTTSGIGLRVLLKFLP